MAGGLFDRTLKRLQGGYFPHQLAFLIDNPLRRLLISPEELADRLELAGTETVLEVGPGSGYFSVELARRLEGGRLELFDLQQEMLDKARRKLERAGFRHVVTTRGDARELPYPSARFDLALLVAVLGEVPEPRQCLRSLHRVLRPGGVLAFHEHVPDPDRLSLPRLRELAESEGFTFVDARGPSWSYTARFRRGR